jgi:triosephosphate isomerase
MMRRPLVAGNWKMNGSRSGVAALVAGIKEGMATVRDVEVAVCPPFVFLPEVRNLVAGSELRLGAQDLSCHAAGAFTGEISGAMLVECGCGYVIVGHSERRAYHAENDDLVADKMVVAHKAGLVPIVCVGETLDEREQDRTEQVIARQIDALLSTTARQAALAAAVIAYEPVWAIGTGKTATPEQAQQVHAFIRGRLSGCDSGLAARTRVLYGGSVKADNAAELFAKPDIDGGLVGGASLNADEFLAICRAAQAK